MLVVLDALTTEGFILEKGSMNFGFAARDIVQSRTRATLRARKRKGD